MVTEAEWEALAAAVEHAPPPRVRFVYDSQHGLTGVAEDGTRSSIIPDGLRDLAEALGEADSTPATIEGLREAVAFSVPRADAVLALMFLVHSGLATKTDDDRYAARGTGTAKGAMSAMNALEAEPAVT